MINAIDVSKWVGSPPEKEFIIQDWLSIGNVSYLSGDYEVGKSLLVQQLMTAVATGKPWLSIDVKQVKTYALFCEDEKKAQAMCNK
ncbi:AAA family ATPase [Wolbachia endosymbiont (group A) of Bibio marci]|uniref:AAA family ATPase n=1 Tax=Wolbachia endosymbiont (group A) of Bibio marci TaxID=2953987 RepID=UPI002232A6C4|nr:AAA family ATPase [Wolbachia endosymbiont (group A) of Bibio marci]